MATHAYDDLYSYLAAFKNSSLAEIIAYLEELGQRRFDAFIRGLAPLIPIEKIENRWRAQTWCKSVLRSVAASPDVTPS